MESKMRVIFGQWLRVRESFGGYSNHGAACGRFFQYNGTGTHDGLLADFSARQHDGADSDMRERSNSYTPTEDSAGRDMDVCVDSAIVLDYRPTVNNAVRADDRPSVYNHSGHYDGSKSDACRRSNDGG
jgi:hypothetical protein